MQKKLIPPLLLYVNGGIVLPLFIGVHKEAKKSVNILASIQKSETDLAFTNKGGISGIFLSYKNLFNIDQCVLGDALGQLSL